MQATLQPPSGPAIGWAVIEARTGAVRRLYRASKRGYAAAWRAASSLNRDRSDAFTVRAVH